jgi:hypothetical protein
MKIYNIFQIKSLFNSFDILPTIYMTLEEQIKTLFRMILLITIFIFIFDIKYSFVFLTISIIFIIIIYYFQKKQMNKKIIENFKYNSTIIPATEPLPCLTKPIEINNENVYDLSLNQKLTGYQQHPYTKIKPIIVAKSHDLDHWKENDLVKHSSTNNSNIRNNTYLSGYDISTCCGYLNEDSELVPTNSEYNNKNIIEKYGKEIKNVYDNMNEIGNIPYNIPTGKCNRNPLLSDYNKNLFTQIVTPGVYSYNEVNEPIHSNIGISAQQDLQPLHMERNENGLFYNRKNVNMIETNNSTYNSTYDINEPTYDNVYDPRFYGYGTTYRSYLEPITGQVRFTYDDVNSVKMPNYISRSKIDHLSYSNNDSENGNIHNPHIRSLVQDSWLRNSIDFRDDITEKLMRKKNNEAWQRRHAPIASYRR